MQVAIRRMGNSQGIVIPKLLLAQLGLDKLAALEVKTGVIEIRPPRPPARAGWEADCARLAAEADDALVWPDLANDGDAELSW